MTLSKTHLHIVEQPGRFLGRLLGPLLKTDLSLMKNALKPLVKSVLIPLGLTEAASTADASFHKYQKFLVHNVWTRYNKINNFE